MTNWDRNKADRLTALRKRRARLYDQRQSLETEARLYDDEPPLTLPRGNPRLSDEQVDE